MRRTFAKELHHHMQENPDIWVVTGDLGYGMFDLIRKDFPERFINTGAAEQAMMDIGIGLALAGKTPFVYSITPFLLYRPFESLRTYINHEKIPVKLIGSGRDRDYSHDGFSHHAEDDREIMALLPNITSTWPETKEQIPSILTMMIADPAPYYLNLTR